MSQQATQHPSFIMNDGEREKWVTELGKRLGCDFAVKFMRGRREHGCDIGSVPTERLIEEAKNEALDQLAYVAELERRNQLLLNYIATLETQLKDARHVI